MFLMNFTQSFSSFSLKHSPSYSHVIQRGLNGLRYFAFKCFSQNTITVKYVLVIFRTIQLGFIRKSRINKTQNIFKF